MMSLEQERDAVLALWQELIPRWSPSPMQVERWLDYHAFTTLIFAVRQTARKNDSMRWMTPEHLIRYASKTMNQYADKQQRERDLAA
jgi:hypothetical protein